MVQLNTLEQYDTTNAWFTICSVGAVFSLVFSIMGIKWWFRKRITFEHDPSVESIVRPGRSQQNISVATTGIYRANKDVDSFEVSERPKTLPPVKTRQSSGQPFLPVPVRHTFVDKSSEGQRPVPVEIIPIPAERIPKSPPSTPISAVRDDFSKPVAIDINIPGESGCIIQTENELAKPEVHQRLTLTDDNLNQTRIEMGNEVIVPKPKARKRISVAEAAETAEGEMTKSLSDLKQDVGNPPPVFETMMIKSNKEEVAKLHQSNNKEDVTDPDHFGSSEIVASSEKLNEFEAFIEQERKEMESMKQSKPLHSVEIQDDPSSVIPVKLEKAVKIIEEQPVPADPTQTIMAQPAKTIEEEHIDVPQIQDDARVPEKIKPPYLNLDEPLDASNIVSPKPRMRKGILKKKAPPVPIVTAVEDTKTIESDNNEQQHATIRWSETEPEEATSESLEANVKKEVKFDNSEPDIIPDNASNEKKSVIAIIQEIEEATREHETWVEIDDKISEEDKLEENEQKGFTQVIAINQLEETIEDGIFVQVIAVENPEEKLQEKRDFIPVIAIENFEEVIVRSPENIQEDQEYVKVELIQSTDVKSPVAVDPLSKWEVIQKEVVIPDPELIKNENQVVSKTNRSVAIEDESIILEQKYLEALLKVSETESVELEKVVVLNDGKIEESHEHKLEKNEVVVMEEVNTKQEIIENPQETKDNDPPSKEPVPTPRKMVKIIDDNLEINIKDKEVVQPSIDTWEPQTIVYNDQVLVMTPPPTYPPPMLPNSYLSDDSEESVSSEEYDEKNPPKPPKRYRIYVVNSDGGDNTKVKPILKTRPPVKRVSFDNASPDIHLMTPDIPSSVDRTDTESLTSPLMPNLLNDVSPKVRSVGFDTVMDRKEDVSETKSKDDEVDNLAKEEIVEKGEPDERLANIRIEQDDSDMASNGSKELNLEKKQEESEAPLMTTKCTQDTSEEDQKELIETPTANLLNLDDTAPDNILDIQSPLEEKVAYFKSLAEKLNDSPVKSLDREFAELLSPEPIIIGKGLNGDEKNKVSDEQTLHESQAKPVKPIITTENIDVRPEPQTIPRPTSLLLKDPKMPNTNKNKIPRRQISEPALSPRDALLAEIRSFAEKKKLGKRESAPGSTTGSLQTSESEKIKIDIEEALI